MAAQKSVFAHIVVGNTAAHNIETWKQDIKLAGRAGIEAFVLNIAHGDPNTPAQVANAFRAAETFRNFDLFFAFDYLGGPGPNEEARKWPVGKVIGFLNQYKNSSAYFKVNGKLMVSTFEGVKNTEDWAHGGAIRSGVGNPIHFVPAWTSLGPDGIRPHLNKIEGAFSWNMWPEGPTNKNIDSDNEWKQVLNGKDYMMGVAPWFFRSAGSDDEPPESRHNWLWRGDDLWTHRWAQTRTVAPRFVQIVSWNDYGESHYIGPNPVPSEVPKGSHAFVEHHPHTGWLSLLPYHIAKYKGKPYHIIFDKMTFWYRDSPVSYGDGDSAWTEANNRNYQPIMRSRDVVQDKIFFSALLKAPSDVRVQIGSFPATTFKGQKGFNHWSQPFNGQTGETSFTVARNGKTIYSKKGRRIENRRGRSNFNAWVGSF